VQVVIHNAGELNQAAASLGRALRNQYAIGYVPQGANRNGKWAFNTSEGGLARRAGTRAIGVIGPMNDGAG
jgi:hypothetical protein